MVAVVGVEQARTARYLSESRERRSGSQEACLDHEPVDVTLVPGIDTDQVGELEACCDVLRNAQEKGRTLVVQMQCRDVLGTTRRPGLSPAYARTRPSGPQQWSLEHRREVLYLGRWHGNLREPSPESQPESEHPLGVDGVVSPSRRNSVPAQ